MEQILNENKYTFMFIKSIFQVLTLSEKYWVKSILFLISGYVTGSKELSEMFISSHILIEYQYLNHNLSPENQEAAVGSVLTNNDGYFPHLPLRRTV